MKSKYQDSRSFSGKTRIALVFLAIIPMLMVVYLFIDENVTLTEKMIFFSPLVLFSILTGFALLRTSADQLADLAKKTDIAEKPGTIEANTIKGDQECNDIVEHFNAVVGRLAETERAIREQTVQLMVYAGDFSLSYRRMKEEEELRNRLGRYVSKNLVEKLVDSKDKVFPENEKREVTILFADIRSFTAIAERITPVEVVTMLNQFFNTMAEIIFENQGVLDKLVGDQLMAVFGLIPSENSHAYDAVLAALTMQDANDKLMRTRIKNHEEVFKMGIGINTGHGIVGNVGAENRMDYTVIGDSVNVAARLEQMARGEEIIVGEQTFLRTQDHFRMEMKGTLHVKNRAEPVLCYRMLR